MSLAWARTFNRLVTGGAVVLGLFLLLLPLAKEVRVARRFRRARTPGATVAASFAQFEDEARAMGFGRPPGETATGFAERVASERVVPRPAAMRLAGLFDKASFAPSEPELPEVAEARGLARSLRASLWASASWLSRARRLWSPRVR